MEVKTTRSRAAWRRDGGSPSASARHEKLRKLALVGGLLLVAGGFIAWRTVQGNRREARIERMVREGGGVAAGGRGWAPGADGWSGGAAGGTRAGGQAREGDYPGQRRRERGADGSPYQGERTGAERTQRDAAPRSAGRPGAPAQPEGRQRRPGPDGPGRGRGGGMAAMTAGLNLTPAQQKQVQALEAESRTQMQALRADTSMTREQRFARMRQLRNQQVQKLMQTLTPEQREEVGKRRNGEGWRTEGRGRRGRPGGSRGPGGPGGPGGAAGGR